jgi:GntR family transcriptional regulator, transcriptional repressor for pyruvate dehydrogenase complex
VFSSPPSRAQVLAGDIERDVVDRGLAAGERIATMDELRTRTGLGRATISEAARLLSERGTVDVRPGRNGGLFVAAPDPVVRLRHTLLAAGQDASAVANALAVRDALEELIDTDAARHRDDGDVEDLHAILERMRADATTRDAFLKCNWELHTRIAQITPNDIARDTYLGTMSYAVGLPSRADAETATDERAYLETRFEVHADLVNAIAAADVDGTILAVGRHKALLAGST